MRVPTHNSAPRDPASTDFCSRHGATATPVPVRVRALPLVSGWSSLGAFCSLTATCGQRCC